MPQAVRQLLAVARLEVGEQVELAAVVRAVAAAVQRNDTLGQIAATERARHQMGGVDRPPVADEARLSGDLGPLRLGGRANGRTHQRPRSPEPARSP